MKNKIAGKSIRGLKYDIGKPFEDGSYFKFILFILFLIGLIIRLYISWQDIALLFQKCVVDDAFFYLNIAKNISAGKGATFDGSILTNGFHPIYALLLVPLFWLIPDNPDLTFHLALTMISVFNVLTGVVIYLIVKHIAGRIAGLIASFIWLFNPYVIMISLNGVEVGVATFFLALCIYQYLKMRKLDSYSARDLILLGVSAALAILSRIDAVFMLAALTIFIFHGSYTKQQKLSSAVSQAALFNVVVFAVLAPWFLWNLYNFGTIRQISGVTLPNIAHNMYLMKYKAYFSFSLIRTELSNLRIWAESIVGFSGGLPLFIAAFMTFIWICRNNIVTLTKELILRLSIMNFAFLSAFLLVSFYALYFWGWFRPWYYLSIVLTVTIGFGIFTGYILQRLSVSNPSFVVRGRHLLAMLLALSFYFYVQGTLIWEKGLFPFQKQLYESAVWINKNTEENTKIGAISSGIYGYITQRTTDLLGVVNVEAYRAMREKRIFSYMKEKNIEYLVDREDMIRFFSERFDKDGFLDKLILIKRFGDKDSDVVVYRIASDKP
jgi:hypothetical protein